MKIARKISAIVKTETYYIEDPVHGMLVFIDYFNESDKVIDSALRYQTTGESIDDPALFNAAQDVVDSYTNKE